MAECSTNPISELPKSMDFGIILIHDEVRISSDSVQNGNSETSLSSISVSPTAATSICSADDSDEAMALTPAGCLSDDLAFELLSRATDLKHDITLMDNCIQPGSDEYELRPAQGCYPYSFLKPMGKCAGRKEAPDAPTKSRSGTAESAAQA